MNEKYTLIVFGLNSLTTVATNLSDYEQQIVVNFALPFGTDWGNLLGARAIKVFPLDRTRSVVAFTVVKPSSIFNRRGELCCLATLVDSTRLDRTIRENIDWERKIFGKLLLQIDDSELTNLLKQHLFIEAKQTAKVAGIKRRFGFRYWPYRIPFMKHWLDAQLHNRITITVEYQDIAQWAFYEHYIRRIFLATYWQRNFWRRFGRNPNLPSFTTFTLSENEITQIVSIAYVTPRERTPVTLKPPAVALPF